MHTDSEAPSTARTAHVPLCTNSTSLLFKAFFSFLFAFACFTLPKTLHSRRPDTLVPGDDRYHGLDKVMHYLFNHVVVNKPSDPVKDLIEQVRKASSSLLPLLPLPPLLLPVLPIQHIPHHEVPAAAGNADAMISPSIRVVSSSQLKPERQVKCDTHPPDKQTHVLGHISMCRIGRRRMHKQFANQYMQHEHWWRSQTLIPAGCLAAGVSLIRNRCGFFRAAG
jgi:hypothetical protein